MRGFGFTVTFTFTFTFAVALFAQDAPSGADARLDKLEKDLEATRAELEALKKAGGAGGPSAAAQGEKFEKKWGKDALPTWSNGFQLLFLDPDATDPEKRAMHRFGVNGRLQVDFRTYQDHGHPARDRFFIRRGRLNANGTFWRYHDFLVEADFGQFGTNLTEAYLNLGYWKQLQLRFGQFKEPWSLERATSSRYLNFIERHMAKRWTNVDFDIGAMVHGDLDYAQYQVAVQNGTSTNVPDTNDEKDMNMRLVLTPFKPGGGALETLMLGGSYNFGHQDDFLPVFRTEGVDGGANPGGAPSQFLTVPAGTTQEGRRTRAGGEFRFEFTPVTLQSELTWMRVRNIQAPGGLPVNLSVRGAYLDLLFMVTGEANPYTKRVIPKRNFDPHEGGWGAWQLGVRWDHTHVEEDAREDIGAVGANEVNALVLGVNWYLNPLFKMQFNYNRNWFNRDAANTGRDTEDVFMIRAAMEF